MAKFLAVYTGKPGAGAPDQATIAKGGQAWSEWMAKNADKIVETGGPLGKTKRVTKDGIADTTNNLSAYVIVDVADHDAAAKLFLNHPHFSIFPGDGVDIMPCMPIPSF